MRAVGLSAEADKGERLADRMVVLELQNAVTAAVTGVGTTRSKRLGRAMVAAFALVNIFIFYTNVRNMMGGGEMDDDPPQLGRNQLPGDRYRSPHPHLHPPATAPVGGVSSVEFRDARRRAIPGVVARKLPVMITVMVDVEDMAVLRRLVGSVHYWHPELELIVYQAVGLPEEKASELLSWRGVTVVPVTRALRDLLHDMTMRSLSLEQGVLGRLAEDQLEGEVVGVGAEAGESEGRGAEGPSEQQLSEAASDVTEWHPIVLYHAVQTKEAALLLQPWGVLEGWVDHVFKALMRDGAYFVCPDKAASAAQRRQVGLVGYSSKSSMIPRQLAHQAACALGAPCAEQPVGREVEEGMEEEQARLGGGNGGGGDGDDALDDTEAGGVVVGVGVGVGGVWEAEGELCHEGTDARIDTSLRVGRGEASLDPDALGHGGGGGRLDEGGSSQQRSEHLTARYQCQLLLKDGTQLAGELQYASEAPPQFAYAAQPPIHIAVGIPTTTKGTQINSPDQLPVLTATLPSMLNTIDGQSTKYRYTVYIGYEVGDRVMDRAGKLERLGRRLGDLVAASPVQVKVLRFPAVHSTTSLWNALFHVADEEGADYFLAAHDDTEFTPPAQMGGAHKKLWSDAVTEALKNSPTQVDFGVAAPTDRRSVQLVTHPMVHIPTHKDIFGSLFPPNLGNQEHEQWISRVYGPRSTFLLTSVGVYNGHRFTGRGQGCRQGAEAVEFAVEDGAAAVKAWVEAKMGKYGRVGGALY